jgi:hypothetical protein
MSTLIYLYNPENFPGLDVIRMNLSTAKDFLSDHSSTLLNLFDLTIDGVPYALAAASLPASEWDTFR